MKRLLSFALLSTSCILFADESRMRNIENRLTCLEDCGQNCCCLINPPARPYTPDCWGFYVNVDPLIWQAHVNGLGLVIQTNGSTDFFNTAGQSRVQNLNYDWDWGFRLGVGLNTTHDAWDILLQWTSWRTDAKRDFTAGPNQANFPHFGHPRELTEVSANSVVSKWVLRYNILDLEGAREFWVSKCVSLRPFGGLRSAWINQKEFNIDLKDPSIPIFESYSIQQSDRFWGIGIRTGLDMQWGIACGFSLFNNFAGNLLYSYHSVKHKEKGDDENLFDVENFYHLGSAIFDMQLGIRYDWISCDCCYHVGLDLGWEHHWHPGQNQFLLFVDDAMAGKYVANQGDLGIQGYFLKVRFDF
ncbi:MAG: hypothetical protein K1000chlam3_00820 [Chlamydiae bacterium]|nr:hypothetical protein [Chlamydiota bacterium]